MDRESENTRQVLIMARGSGRTLRNLKDVVDRLLSDVKVERREVANWTAPTPCDINNDINEMCRAALKNNAVGVPPCYPGTMESYMDENVVEIEQPVNPPPITIKKRRKNMTKIERMNQYGNNRR